jgi:Na+-driven multidrug efflux pump
VLLSLIVIVLVVAFRESVSSLYTKENSLLELTQDTIIYMFPSLLLDALKGVLAGVLRGIG